MDWVTGECVTVGGPGPVKGSPLASPRVLSPLNTGLTLPIPQHAPSISSGILPKMDKNAEYETRLLALFKKFIWDFIFKYRENHIPEVLFCLIKVSKIYSYFNMRLQVSFVLLVTRFFFTPWPSRLVSFSLFSRNSNSSEKQCTVCVLRLWQWQNSTKVRHLTLIFIEV